MHQPQSGILVDGLETGCDQNTAAGRGLRRGRSRDFAGYDSVFVPGPDCEGHYAGLEKYGRQSASDQDPGPSTLAHEDRSRPGLDSSPRHLLRLRRAIRHLVGYDPGAALGELAADDKVQQSAYFCNAYFDPAATPPFSDSGFPARQREQVVQNSLSFLNKDIGLLWPNAVTQGAFDLNLLVSIASAAGPARFAEQFFRVNIDPSELDVLSLPGTTKYRLAPGNSRFANLYLAGDWTLNDLNVGCIEATVISGRLASRAISGKPDFIYGSFGSSLS